MNVVIDTGVVVAAIFWLNEPRRCLAAFARRRFSLFVTTPILEEYERVAREVRIQEQLERDPAPALSWIQRKAHRVEPLPLPKPVCRDAEDDKFLECALAARATVLVSRDRDLLTLHQPFGIRVVTPRQLYLYAQANPVNNIDPSGHMTLAAQLPTFGTISTLAGLSLPSLAGAKSAALTLTLAIAAGASLSGSTEAAQEQAPIQAAEMTLAGAGTSMANEISKAQQIWRTRNGNSRIPKIVPVPGFLLPNVAQNVALAQLSCPFGPFLNRAPPCQGAKNRYQVLKGRGSAGPGRSWDE